MRSGQGEGDGWIAIFHFLSGLVNVVSRLTENYKKKYWKVKIWKVNGIKLNDTKCFILVGILTFSPLRLQRCSLLSHCKCLDFDTTLRIELHLLLSMSFVSIFFFSPFLWVFFFSLLNSFLFIFRYNGSPTIFFSPIFFFLL